MKIQEVAEQTHLSIHTLRYYERLGLITPIARTDNGHREYTEDDVYQLIFVSGLRAMGMPISQIQCYATLSKQGDATVADRLEILEAHETAVEQQLEEMQKHLKMIRRKIAHYRESNSRKLGENRSTT